MSTQVEENQQIIKNEDYADSQDQDESQDQDNEDDNYSQDNDNDNDGDDDQERRFIRLRGLSWSVTHKEIIDFLTGVNIVGGDKGIHLVTNRWNGKNTGEAFIEIASQDDEDAAFKHNKENLGHRYIEVFTASVEEAEFAIRKPGGTLSNVVKLRGLPYAIDEPTIEEFFQGLEIKPDREGILILMDKRGRPTGEAYVQFETQEDTESALKRNREKIGHRYIEIFRSSIAEMKRQASGNRPGPYDKNDRGGGIRGNYGGRGGGDDFRGGNNRNSRGDRGSMWSNNNDMGGNGGGGFGGGGNFGRGNNFGNGGGFGNNGGGGFGGNGPLGFNNSSFGNFGNNGGSNGGGGLGNFGNFGSNRPNFSNDDIAKILGNGNFGNNSSGGNFGSGLFGGGNNFGNNNRGGSGSTGGGGTGSGNFSDFGPVGGGRFNNEDLFCVHLRGLPYYCFEQDVEQFFEPLHPANVKIIYNNKGLHSGSADAYFDSHEEAVQAMKKHREKMGSRYIELFYDGKGKKDGFRRI